VIQPPTNQPAPAVINYKTVSARLVITPSNPAITLDGVAIGTLKREMDDTRMVWAATLTDVQGHRGGYFKNGSLVDLTQHVTNKVVDILRRHNPDADWGVLYLEATPGELVEIADGRRHVLRFPHGLRYAQRACPAGRKVVIRNPLARGRGHPAFEGAVESVRRVPRAQALAADRLLEYRHPNAKHFSEVTFNLLLAVAGAEVKAQEPAAALPGETQASILEWKRATFGVSTPMRQMARAVEEAAELFRAVTSGADPSRVSVEAADVALILADIGELLGVADWLADGRPTRISQPERLVAFVVTQLGCLAREVAEIDPEQGESGLYVPRSILRSIIGALQELVEFGDLKGVIDAKMAINRARVWSLDGTGHGYHRSAA
jgi:hypothetical protein